jgi:ribA/ribD-fused uncharacterized protein
MSDLAGEPIREFQGAHRFLSNFWPAEVVLDNYPYRSVEHAYQAAKTLDLNMRKQIRHTEKPGEVKRLGRRVQMRPDWEEVKLHVMEDLVRQKFTRHPDLKARLLATGNAELQEGNSWNDVFWGINLRSGEGQNHLGKILMKVRNELGGP